MSGLHWEAHRGQAAYDLSRIFPQEALGDSECNTRFKATKMVVHMKRSNVRASGFYKATARIPEWKTHDGRVCESAIDVVLATSGLRAEACFAVNLFHAIQMKAHSLATSISEKDVARMRFTRRNSGRRPYRFDAVLSIDLSAPDKTSLVSPEAAMLAQCPTAKLLVWSKFAAVTSAVDQQRRLIPLEGTRKDPGDQQRDVYLGKHDEAAAALREFRKAAAEFVRSRFQYQCAARNEPPEPVFFTAGTQTTSHLKRPRKAPAAGGGKSSSQHTPTSSSSRRSASAVGGAAAAAIGVTFPGAEGAGTPGHWGDGRQDEDPDIDYGDGVQEEGIGNS